MWDAWRVSEEEELLLTSTQLFCESNHPGFLHLSHINIPDVSRLNFPIFSSPFRIYKNTNVYWQFLYSYSGERAETGRKGARKEEQKMQIRKKERKKKETNQENEEEGKGKRKGGKTQQWKERT
ncbi:hypothetical protein ILYODFUR_034191 [Ilyodon furcidens]|uniref:Uncharacterized protein n=1 Tax=Ilyodon furcidens TaxID=33524 RepID=A0ABV0T491_9TELE